MDLVTGFLKRLGYLWYVMDPHEHMYEKVEDVPDYYKENDKRISWPYLWTFKSYHWIRLFVIQIFITPAYIFLIIVEQIIGLFQGRKLMRINDTVSNICQGILMELSKIPLHGIELIVYTWVYNNWRLTTCSWNSVWTWVFCAVAADFCFYWMHRLLHQISFLWAFHETHHSSEDFNLTVPLRLSIFHSATLWITYVPLALAIPPSVFLVHYQLSVILQFWLHTEVIRSVGVLEYIIVTPSHHRVHHGRNRRCIDKNFGSVFIVWDRIFGTFEPEGKESITYGITKPLQTFNPITVQFNHLQIIWRRFIKEEGISNKMSCILKGPGWMPGLTWLGKIEDIPEPRKGDPKYDPKLPRWLEFYVTLHTSALVIGYMELIFNITKVSNLVFIVCSTYMILTTVTIGSLMDLSHRGPRMELLRCFLFYFIDYFLKRRFGSHYALLNISLLCFRCLFLSSFIFWICTFPSIFNFIKLSTISRIPFRLS